MLNFNDSSQWSLLISQDFNAHFIGKDKYKSIGEQPVPILGDKSILAILAETTPGHPVTWDYAGKLNQYLKVNILDAHVVTTAVFKSYPLKLNKVNLIIFDRLATGNYAMTYTPPKWFFYAKLIIWEYMGDVGLTIDDKINELKAIAQSMDTKINTINSTITPKDLYGLP
jgi:hypothetical protein